MTGASGGKGDRFALCINDQGYPVSLYRNKVYRIVPDEKLEGEGEIRVVDESGEDYIYAADRFIVIPLPPEAEEAVVRSESRHPVANEDPSGYPEA